MKNPGSAELFVPSCIPEGWTLDRLELTRTLEGRKTALFVFFNEKGDTFSIDELLLTKDTELSSYMSGEEVVLNNRSVLLLSDDYTRQICVYFIENDLSIVLSGELSQSEQLKVADEMRQGQ